MNFELTQEQKGIKAAARELAERDIQLEMAREFDQKHDFQAICKKQPNQVSISCPFDKYGGQ
ncbi:hypothetical protein E3J51_04230 [Candidatus Bathyarchaeota archaeon]|nr:MAG: hypothetical protein E3J51_04230 [Candidatus Bathyarchaeota archaeon]